MSNERVPSGQEAMSDEQAAGSGEQAASSPDSVIIPPGGHPESSVPNPNRLPVDQKTGRPIPPRATPGYYPGFDTLGQQAFWDEATRAVVLARVEQIPPIRFFTPEQATLLTAICDRLIPQDDRDVAHHIPIVPFIDERLFAGRIDGYRFDDMPPDGEAYRLGLMGIETVARRMHDHSFVGLGPYEQDQVLQTIHDAQPPAGEAIWRQAPVDRFWMLLAGDVFAVYYAHPYAWDEIGFGGPAYPRGYMRLEGGKPEPWEVREQRYGWKAPPQSLSGAYKPLGETHPGRMQPTSSAGTH